MAGLAVRNVIKDVSDTADPQPSAASDYFLWGEVTTPHSEPHFEHRFPAPSSKLCQI